MRIWSRPASSTRPRSPARRCRTPRPSRACSSPPSAWWCRRRRTGRCPRCRAAAAWAGCTNRRHAQRQTDLLRKGRADEESALLSRPGPGEGSPMAPITLQRLVKELDRLKPEADAARLKSRDYARRLARMIRKLRTRGLDADRAAATAALVEALKRGAIKVPMEAHA